MWFDGQKQTESTRHQNKSSVVRGGWYVSSTRTCMVSHIKHPMHLEQIVHTWSDEPTWRCQLLPLTFPRQGFLGGGWAGGAHKGNNCKIIIIKLSRLECVCLIVHLINLLPPLLAWTFVHHQCKTVAPFLFPQNLLSEVQRHTQQEKPSVHRNNFRSTKRNTSKMSCFPSHKNNNFNCTQPDRYKTFLNTCKSIPRLSFKHTWNLLNTRFLIQNQLSPSHIFFSDTWHQLNTRFLIQSQLLSDTTPTKSVSSPFTHVASVLWYKAN